jgi:4'-phosphopantetheinyl transferase
MHDVVCNDVDIYTVDLDAPDISAPGILSPAELDRASRFRFHRDRHRFVHCRATVRRVLADYLDAKPEQIEFSYNAYGKPSVDGIFFNVSHADRVAMIAVSRSREVGIDVERIDSAFAHEQIPERFFSTSEVATLRELPESSQFEAFFDFWTRKEAYMKGRGLGFALPPTSFDVSNLPGNWALETVPAPPGYLAALCVKRPTAPFHNLSIASSGKGREDSRHNRPGGPRHMARNEFQSCDTL